MLEIREVLRRWLRGDSKSAVARQCGVARGTVRSYIKAAEEVGLSLGLGESGLDEGQLAELAARLRPELGRPRGDGWECCQEHRGFIAGKLEQGVRLTRTDPPTPSKPGFWPTSAYDKAAVSLWGKAA